MNEGQTIFSQLVKFLPKKEFDKLVNKYKGNYRARSFSCWDQYLCMLFAQLTYRESLRDIEICLRGMSKKLYHSGIRGKVSRSTLADANNSRDWRIYRDFALGLIKEARALYADEKLGNTLEGAAYAFDATIISLCLSVFPWAKYKEKKAGIKLHTTLDLSNNIPVFIDISEAAKADVKALDNLILEPGAYYVLDRAYIDFARLYKFSKHSSFFIVRAKKGLAFKRLYSHKVDKKTGLRSDQTIKLSSRKSRKNYPDNLRRIRFYDIKNNQYLVLLTNNFLLDAITIAELYHYRWQVELFFRWIKQHLKIKSFFGTSTNAVNTQIWIAISSYVLIALVKKRLKIDKSLYSILQFLSISIFEKIPLLSAFQDFNDTQFESEDSNQLNLFDS